MFQEVRVIDVGIITHSSMFQVVKPMVRRIRVKVHRKVRVRRSKKKRTAHSAAQYTCGLYTPHMWLRAEKLVKH